MSYINKPGKTSAWRQMVIRQQVSDVIAYGKIETTLVKAKETQKHLEKLITIAKNDNLANRRKALSILLNTKKIDRKDLVDKLFKELGKEYINRNGGYTRVLKLDKRRGDNTRMSILTFVK